MKQVLVRVQNPQVPEETLVATKAGAIWSVFRKLTRRERVDVTTDYEKAKDRLETMEAEAANLRKERRALLDVAGAHLSQGVPVSTKAQRLQDVDLRLEVLDRAISSTKGPMERSRAEYLRTQVARLEERRRPIEEERVKALAAWEQEQVRHSRVEKEWQQGDHAIRIGLEDIDRALRSLRDELALSELEPEPSATRTVAEWLADFRAGRIHTFTSGQDLNGDEAHSQYEQEYGEIRAWARRDARGRESDGTRTKPPECARHWTNQRVEELYALANAPVRGGSAMKILRRPGVEADSLSADVRPSRRPIGS